MSDHIVHHDNDDSIDPQGFLKFIGQAPESFAQGWGAEVFFPEPISPRRGSMKGGLNFVWMSDNHVGFNEPTNPAVIASLRAWITQEETIQYQVTLETTKPGEYGVTGNNQ